VASSGPFTLLPYGQSASLRTTPSVGRRSTSSAAGLPRSKASDSFALSSASKKSAPASLAHPQIRQSRSTEPRRQQREKSETENSLSRKVSKKKTNGNKKRREKAGRWHYFFIKMDLAIYLKPTKRNYLIIFSQTKWGRSTTARITC